MNTTYKIEEKKYYFIFSKLNTDKSNQVVISLVINYFIENKNQYASLIEISKELLKHGLNFQPETIQSTIEQFNYEEYFDLFLPEKEINEPFRLKKSVFEKFTSYTNHLSVLETMVTDFLAKNSYNKLKVNVIIDILLETIFSRNIEFLKNIISVKEEKEIKKKLIYNEKPVKYTKEDCDIFNNFILSSNKDFNETLKILIYRMFDFFSLNYNPSYKETLQQNFGNKIYYLDSSFIIRLLGFDNEIREERAMQLIQILQETENIQFISHRETITEAQYRIKELIDSALPVIRHREKTIQKILDSIPHKYINILELYLRLKKKGKITGEKDFYLFFHNVSNSLRKILDIKKFRIDNSKIKSSKKARDLRGKLDKTEKSKTRISHIIRILIHIENLRGPNNYNHFDIKYWLITTDNKTLKIDSKLCETDKKPSKSVCVLPTELIRSIDNAGEIKGDYIEVFKKFMLHSHVFSENYTVDDLRTIDKIATLAENAPSNYEAEVLISNLFDKNSFDEIQKRLQFIKKEEEKDKQLIEFFNDANESFIETKYSKLIFKLEKRYSTQAKVIFKTLVFSLPVAFFLLLFVSIINPNIIWDQPLTYIDTVKWGKLEGLFLIIELVLLSSSLLINKRYMKSFNKKYVKRRISKYKGD